MTVFDRSDIRIKHYTLRPCRPILFHQRHSFQQRQYKAGGYHYGRDHVGTGRHKNKPEGRSGHKKYTGMIMNKTKVFCIGFQRTGTTTLARALTLLGYKVTGPNGRGIPDLKNKMVSIVEEASDTHDAFQDNPWPFFYKEMDKRHPGSKFILSLRSTESWFDSVCRTFPNDKKLSTLMEWVYEGKGHPEYNREFYISKFENHNKDVLAYFKDRPDDLLVMDFTKGEDWAGLCRFLGKKIPDKPFPHEHPGTRKKDFFSRKWRKLITYYRRSQNQRY